MRPVWRKTDRTDCRARLRHLLSIAPFRLFEHERKEGHREPGEPGWAPAEMAQVGIHRFAAVTAEKRCARTAN